MCEDLRWAQRYRELGAEGMADRSSRPHHSPRRTPAPMVRGLGVLGAARRGSVVHPGRAFRAVPISPLVSRAPGNVEEVRRAGRGPALLHDQPRQPEAMLRGQSSVNVSHEGLLVETFLDSSTPHREAFTHLRARRTQSQTCLGITASRRPGRGRTGARPKGRRLRSASPQHAGGRRATRAHVLSRPPTCFTWSTPKASGQAQVSVSTSAVAVRPALTTGRASSTVRA
jgi:hypothetical protein